MKTTTPRIATLNQLLQQYNITRWDLLIVADGSGVGWQTGIGWSALLLDHHNGTWSSVGGGQSQGTIGMAELLPFWMALKLHQATIRPSHRTEPLTTHAFSDNETVVNVGNGKAQDYANSDLWEGLRHFLARGQYVVTWHHLPRDTLPIHIMADQLSASARDYAELLHTSRLPPLDGLLPVSEVKNGTQGSPSLLVDG